MNFNSIRNIIITTNWLNRKGFNAVCYYVPRTKKEYKEQSHRRHVDDTTIKHGDMTKRIDIFILDSF
jgi:hypothetical protein